MGYSIEQGFRGGSVLVYRDDNRVIRLHSAYNPEEDARRQVEAFQPGRARHILVAGLGYGYHLDELKRGFPPINCCLPNLMHSCPHLCAGGIRRHWNRFQLCAPRMICLRFSSRSTCAPSMVLRCTIIAPRCSLRLTFTVILSANADAMPRQRSVTC